MDTAQGEPHQSVEEQVKIFQELEAYEWDKDPQFQVGLSAILGSNPRDEQILELTLRAQVFYYSRKKAVPIDFDAYKNFLSNDSTSPSSQSTIDTQKHNQALTSTQTPSNIMAPPNNPPYHPHTPSSTSMTSSSASTYPANPNPQVSALSSDTQSTSQNAVNTPPYPANFLQIVDLITSGAPIPGIKEIPNIVLSDKVSAPQMQKRRKPWESVELVSEDQVQGRIGGVFGDPKRDVDILQEFPGGTA